MITFLSKWSCKVDDAQDRAMLQGPLIILNLNRRHYCPFPHRDPIGAHIPLLVNWRAFCEGVKADQFQGNLP